MVMFAITPKWANCSDLGIICNPSRKWKSVIADALPIKSFSTHCHLRVPDYQRITETSYRDSMEFIGYQRWTMVNSQVGSWLWSPWNISIETSKRIPSPGDQGLVPNRPNRNNKFVLDLFVWCSLKAVNADILWKWLTQLLKMDIIASCPIKEY